jgi:hypothetical protein
MPMDWVVAVPQSETSRAEFSPETEAAACAALHEHGCVLLRGAFSPAIIEAMHRDYVAQFGMLDLAAMGAEAAKPPPNRFLPVGSARFDITLRMTGAFARPEIFANLRLLKLLRPLLGGEIQLSNFTAVVSHPGATQQRPHRDQAHLFAERGVGPNLPVYSVNVAVPLIDVDLETGPTGVWLGSHRWESDKVVPAEAITVCALQRGDCMMLDYRTMHAGVANRSARARPIVYMVYARPWFFDHANHVKRIPIDMPLDLYDALPGVRPLLARAFSYAVMTRWREADALDDPARGDAPASVAAAPGGFAASNAAAPRDLDDPSGRGKVGRNDPCPCGSGRKYKQCHGRLA